MASDPLFGNLKGLKNSQVKQLQKLYHYHLPNDCFTTPEFAQRLAALSWELEQSVSLYVNRRGQVIRVGVGGPRQTQIPPLELPRYGAERLSGIRCLATTLDDAPPDHANLIAMVRQRLDALMILNLSGGVIRRGGGASGFVKQVYLAHLMPAGEGDPWRVSPPVSLDALSQQDFSELVANLEEEFRREFVAQAVDPNHDRVLIVGLLTANQSEQDFHDRLTELERLIDTAGGEVVGIMQQKRATPHPQTVLGTGKIEEVAIQVQILGASLVAFDRDLSPAQIRNLEQQFGVRVVDRTEVILDIFAQRASSQAGKLQVELAQLEYLLPRLVGRGQAMSRLGGGIGTRGPGETKLETERRAIQKRITRLQQEVNDLQAHRARLRKQRQKRDIPTVAIVGYTNAGKSTLLNALTQADVYAADQLFATLDPTTRRLTLRDETTGEQRAILLTDTVGFIHELPPSLVDAFRATLEEITEADLLLHVVDLSHPAWEKQLRDVEAILADILLEVKPTQIVFNKIDCVSDAIQSSARNTFSSSLIVSAKRQICLEKLTRYLYLSVNSFRLTPSYHSW